MKFISVFAAFLLLCCSKSVEPPPEPQRKLQYSVSGNYSGAVYASYTTATGGTFNETITSLPWTKEIIYAASVTAAVIAISGNAGTPGQQVTVVVKKGGAQLSVTTATADSAGSFSRPAPVVIF